MVFKSLFMVSFALMFTGLSLVGVSTLNAQDRMLIAGSFFKAYPYPLSLLD